MDFLIQITSLFQKGGPIMYVMALCSFAAVAIGLERFVYLRRVSEGTAEFQQTLKKFLEGSRFTEASRLCQQFAPNVMAKVAYAGLDAHMHGRQAETALEASAGLAAARLRDHLEDLSMLVTLSPLLGLLGTILGMIQAFSVFNLQNGQPTVITGGIGEALIATATGLCIATFSLLMHRFFSRRVSLLLTNIEQIAALLLGSIHRRTAAKMENCS